MMTMKKNRKTDLQRAFRSGVLNLVIIAGCVIFSLPFLWLIITSFKGPQEIFAIPMQWIPQAFKETPLNWTKIFQNFINAHEFIPFWLWIRNTLHVTVLNVVFNVLISSIVAYGFSRIHWTGRDLVFFLLLATMMLPAQVTMIPSFLIINKLGWYNTLKPLWINSLFGHAFSIFLLRQFMMTIPRDLEDAARIDGCSHFRIYALIVMPLIKPALTVIAIQTFQAAWNNFLGAYIYINTKENMTIALGLQWFKAEHFNLYGEMMATSLVMTLPIIFLFFFFQRYMIQGITLTGMKI